jgi:hypothetical protein
MEVTHEVVPAGTLNTRYHTRRVLLSSGRFEARLNRLLEEGRCAPLTL